MHRREEDYIETAEQIEDVEPLPKQMVSLVYNAGDYETIRELTVKESEIYQKMVPHNLFPVPVGNIMVVIGANLGSNCPSFHSLSLWMILTGCTSILIHMVNVSYLQVAGYLSTHHMIPGWTTITIISLKIVGMILNALEAVALIITTTIIAELYIDGEEIFAREPVSICQGGSIQFAAITIIIIWATLIPSLICLAISFVSVQYNAPYLEPLGKGFALPPGSHP